MGNFFGRLFGNQREATPQPDPPPPQEGRQADEGEQQQGVVHADEDEQQQGVVHADEDKQQQGVVHADEVHAEVPANVDVHVGQGQQEPPEAEQPEPEAEGQDQVLPLKEQPVNTFQYLPDDYDKPRFEKSKNEEANEIVARIEQIFLQEVVAPRKNIDEMLKTFRKKTGKLDTAMLTMCFEQWKTEAFKGMEVPDGQKPAFAVRLNRNDMVVHLCPNESHESLTPDVNETTDIMSELLEACHEFLDSKDNIEKRLRQEDERFAKFKDYSMKTNNAKREIESLFQELKRLTQQVEGLLINIKVAASKTGLTARKITTGVHRLIVD